MLRRAASVTLLALVVLGVGPMPAEATFPGANGRILYWQIRNRSLNLFTIAPSGTDKAAITNLRRPDMAGPASWSPDGSRIVMSASIAGRSDLFILNADGSGITPLGVGGGQDPSWSPDGSTIAFEHSFDLWRVGVDGQGLTQLTSGPALDARPEWSPDGAKILFDSNRSGSFDVWTMRRDGGGLTDLTPNTPGFDAMATWSPDGARIAFTSDRGGPDFNIDVMDAGGANVQRLTKGRRDDELPSWSPDGTSIVFASSRDGDFDLFVIPLGGTGPRVKITHTKVFEESPKWQPLV